MYTLGFSIIWTVLAALFVFYFDLEVGPDYQTNEWLAEFVFTAIPFFGLFFIWDSLRKLRRNRSVRRETADNDTVYVWTDLNGSKKEWTRGSRGTRTTGILPIGNSEPAAYLVGARKTVSRRSVHVRT